MRSLKSIALTAVVALFMSPLAQATPIAFTIGNVTLTGVSCSGTCGNYVSDLGLSTISPLSFTLDVGNSTTLNVVNYTLKDRSLPYSFTVTGNLNFDLTTPTGTTAVILLTSIRVDGTGSNPDFLTFSFGPDDQANFGAGNTGVLNIHMNNLALVNDPSLGDHGQVTGTFTYAVEAVPEPSSVVLLGMGILGVACAVRRKLSI